MITSNKGRRNLEMIDKFGALYVLVKFRYKGRKSSDSEVDTEQSFIGMRHNRAQYISRCSEARYLVLEITADPPVFPPVASVNIP